MGRTDAIDALLVARALEQTFACNGRPNARAIGRCRTQCSAMVTMKLFISPCEQDLSCEQLSAR